jgi:hypothetical protein
VDEERCRGGSRKRQCENTKRKIEIRSRRGRIRSGKNRKIGRRGKGEETNKEQVR